VCCRAASFSAALYSFCMCMQVREQERVSEKERYLIAERTNKTDSKLSEDHWDTKSNALRHLQLWVRYYIFIMRPSSLGGGRILRRTLSVCLSVCPSVCPSIPCLFTLEHRSCVFVNLADVRYLLFCLHARAAYSTAISAAQASLGRLLGIQVGRYGEVCR